MIRLLSRVVHGSGWVSFKPTPTQSASVGWKAEGPETDRQHQSIESVLGLNGAQVGLVGGGSRWSLQMTLESAKQSPESVETHQICIEICTKIFEICWDLAKSG